MEAPPYLSEILNGLEKQAHSYLAKMGVFTIWNNILDTEGQFGPKSEPLVRLLEVVLFLLVILNLLFRTYISSYVLWFVTFIAYQHRVSDGSSHG